MTVDNFGRYITQKLANKIQHIEDADKCTKKYCADVLENLRCPAINLQHLWGLVRNIMLMNCFIIIMLDCKIIFVKYTWNFDLDLEQPDVKERTRINGITDRVLHDGSHIYLVRVPSEGGPTAVLFVY